jgi:FemAB-related protein (PEP-CTERM system-associated)
MSAVASRGIDPHLPGSPDAVEVRELRDSDRAAWDRFVALAPSATFFHLSGWRRIIEEVCGHRTHYLYAFRQGVITGVLPLAEIDSWLFGHSLISTPFCVYGGAAAATDADRIALEDRARSLAEKLRVDYLELRNMKASAGEWLGKDLYVTFRKPIAVNDDDNLKAIPRKQRAVVRKGIDAGLRSEVDGHVERFYALYSESVRNLGTPILGKRFFAALLAEFGAAADVVTIMHGDIPVSSVLSFYFRDEVLPYYGGGGGAARDVKANDFMYWELMRRSVARGVRVFDFGRSKQGTGSYNFKKNWGFEPQTLEYQYHLVRASSLPDVSPVNPKYQAMIAAWKRLPLWVTQRLGPPIARNLG